MMVNGVVDFVISGNKLDQITGSMPPAEEESFRGWDDGINKMRLQHACTAVHVVSAEGFLGTIKLLYMIFVIICKY